MITEKQMNFIWFQLCSNFYESYNKTQELKEEYYNQIKDRKFEEINNKINILISKKNGYCSFPTVKEILEAKEREPYWLDNYETLEKILPTPEKQKELDELVAELTGEKEEDYEMEM